MPTYDYRCERTGEMFEIWQSFSDDALTVCPETHTGETSPCGAPVKKVFSKVGISFKGDGFYKNDYGARKPPGSSEKKESSDSSSSGASKDSTPSAPTSDASSSTKGSGNKGSSDKGSGNKGSTPAD